MKHSHAYDELKQNGIYAIVRGDEIYIGSTRCSFSRRMMQHKSSLRNGTHPNPRLQNIFNKHGDIFDFKIIEVCCKDHIVAEQKWIDYLSIDKRKLLNISTIAGSVTHTDEWKKNMSIIMTGRKASDEAKAAMSIAAMKPHRLAQLRAASDDPALRTKRYAAIAKALTGKKQPNSVKEKSVNDWQK